MAILGAVNDTVSEDFPDYGPHESGDIYRVLKCPNCKKVNISSYSWRDSIDEGDEVAESILYPQYREFPVGLPDDILSSLISAEKVKLIDSQSYALMLGRILELVCHNKGAKGKTFYEMLEDLAARNEIPEKLIKVANGLRNFRNIGAHAGSAALSPSELPIVRALLDAILAYLYSAQHLADLAESKLSKIKNRHKTKGVE
jgi:hypothetical protein